MAFGGANGVCANQFHAKWCRMIFATSVGTLAATQCSTTSGVLQVVSRAFEIAPRVLQGVVGGVWRVLRHVVGLSNGFYRNGAHSKTNIY